MGYSSDVMLQYDYSSFHLKGVLSRKITDLNDIMRARIRRALDKQALSET